MSIISFSKQSKKLVNTEIINSAAPFALSDGCHTYIFAISHNISLPLPSHTYTKKFVYCLSVVSV